jgi:hypothetical protein
LSISTAIAGRDVFSQAADAHRFSDGGHADGKIVPMP